MKLPTNRWFLASCMLALCAGFIIVFNAHRYTIAPDGYEYLLAARNFGENGRLDTTLGNSYWAPNVLTSRLGYSLILGIIAQISHLDLIAIAKILGTILFFINSMLVLWFFQRRFKRTHAFVLWLMFGFSYSTLFWSGLLSTDLLGQTIVIASLIYLYSNSKQRWFEISLYFAALLIRWELVLPLAAVMLIKYSNKQLLRQLINITIALLFAALVVILTISRITDFISFSIPDLSSTVNISLPFVALSILLVIIGTTFAKINRVQIRLHFIFILAFLLLGVGFLDTPDFSSSLENLWFLISHELIVWLVIAFTLWWAGKRIAERELSLILIFFAGLVTYHFYFQHITMLLPFVYFAVAEVLSRHQLPALPRFMYGFLIIIPLYTLVAFTHYHLNQADLYLQLAKAEELANCVKADFIATNFVIPAAYNFYDQREKLYPMSELDLADSVIVDSSYPTELRAELQNLSRLTFENRIFISGVNRYSPTIYFNCPANDTHSIAN
jgi:hypothetical protein